MIGPILVSIVGTLALSNFALSEGLSSNLDQDDLDRALREASSTGRYNDLEAAIRAGANPQNRNNYGVTPLHLASLFGHSKIVSKLIRVGANPDQADDRDFTPLMHASFNCNPRTVYALAKAHANPNRSNHVGQTALMNAAEQACPQVVEILLQMPGIDVNARNIYGKTAYDYAKENYWMGQDMNSLEKIHSRGGRSGQDPDPPPKKDPPTPKPKLKL